MARIHQRRAKVHIVLQSTQRTFARQEYINDVQKFAELIVKQCVIRAEREIIRNGDTEHNRAVHMVIGSIKQHFEIEEQTPSQKMADAGYTRRPKGWTKEDEE